MHPFCELAAVGETRVVGITAVRLDTGADHHFVS
jgi:hypothetical protein